MSVISSATKSIINERTASMTLTGAVEILSSGSATDIFLSISSLPIVSLRATYSRYCSLPTKRLLIHHTRARIGNRIVSVDLHMGANQDVSLKSVAAGLYNGCPVHCEVVYRGARHDHCRSSAR